MDRDASILVWVSSALSSHGINLVRRVSSIDVAILQHNSCIPKDEVNGAIDVTLSIKLTL